MSAMSMAPHMLQHAGAGAEGDQHLHSSAGSDVALLDSLPKAQQELAVTRMLDQSKQWLDRAMEATNPAREVSEFKAFVATVAEAAKQKKLSEDIQLDSTEMVRRAERALGVAIRKGQEAGEIVGQGKNRLGEAERNSAPEVRDDRVSPAQFFGNGQAAHETYAMTDDVSNEQFEDALADAREEGNLSRANVVRKVKAEKAAAEERRTRPEQSVTVESRSKPGPKPDEELTDWHQSLAERYPTARAAFEAEGHTRYNSTKSFQGQALRAGAKYRFTEKSYARHAAQSQDWLDRTTRNIETAITMLDNIDFSTITPEQAEEALQRLASTRQLTRFIKTLKEISNVQESSAE